MPDGEAAFLVNPYSDPVLVKIQGRASFLNATPVGEFFRQMVGEGKRRFLIDFEKCTGMDSTFLGILAGAGINLMKVKPAGQMILSRLSPRNLELVRNLGLDRLMAIDGKEVLQQLDEATGHLDPKELPHSDAEKARMVLQAHENLIELDPANADKFQDVIAFLRNQAES